MSNSNFYILIFDDRGRSVSPLYPVKKEAVEDKLSLPPYGRLQIDPENFAIATAHANDTEVEEPFTIGTPLNTDLFDFYRSLAMVVVELPTLMAFKYSVQGKSPYTDNLFFRIKFSNPERHLRPICEYLISQGFYVSLDRNLGEDTVIISLPAFFGYEHLVKEADKIADWLSENKLTVARSRLHLITYATEESRSVIYYLGPAAMKEGETFVASDIEMLGEDWDEF